MLQESEILVNRIGEMMLKNRLETNCVKSMVQGLDGMSTKAQESGLVGGS